MMESPLTGPIGLWKTCSDSKATRLPFTTMGRKAWVAVPLLKKAEFRAVPKDAPPGDDVLARLIGALRAGQIGTAKGLDTRLEPICRVGPVYPKALREHGRPTGRP